MTRGSRGSPFCFTRCPKVPAWRAVTGHTSVRMGYNMADNMKQLESLIEAILSGDRETTMTITQLLECLSQPYRCERLLKEMS